MKTRQLPRDASNQIAVVEAEQIVMLNASCALCSFNFNGLLARARVSRALFKVVKELSFAPPSTWQ